MEKLATHWSALAAQAKSELAKELIIRNDDILSWPTVKLQRVFQLNNYIKIVHVISSEFGTDTSYIAMHVALRFMTKTLSSSPPIPWQIYQPHRR